MSSNFIYLDNDNKLINLSSVDLTADKLTVDNIVINGTTIGHTADSDLITLANESVTFGLFIHPRYCFRIF